MTADQFANQIKKGGEPASLYSWDRTDKQKVDVNGHEKRDIFPSVGKKKAQKKGAESDENRKVKTGDGENVLQALSCKLIAK